MTPQERRAALAKALNGAIGENAQDSVVTQFIDTGYAPLNYHISGKIEGGGIPFGRIGEMYGESGTGKTALATKWMGNAQKMGGIAMFNDWERSFNSDLAQGFGLDISPGMFVFKRPRTWEEGMSDGMNFARIVRQTGMIDETAPIIIVSDSIASAIPMSAMYDSKGNPKPMDSLTMNDTTALARATGNLKYVSQAAADYNATFLFLNQMRLKIGVVFGDPRTTPGGKAPEFYSSFRIALGKSKIANKTTKEFEGNDISIQITKSKHTRAWGTCNLRLVYPQGGVAPDFDYLYSGIELCVEKKWLVKDGNKIAFNGKTYYVGQLAELLRATPGGEDAIYQLIQKNLADEQPGGVEPAEFKEAA